MTQTAEKLTRALGRNVKYVQVPWEQFRENAGGEMAQMFRWSSASAMRSTAGSGTRWRSPRRRTSTAPRSSRCRARSITRRTRTAIERRVAPDVARLWAHMCPAQVYEVGAEEGDGTVMVDVAPSNCVQCGAITAKGGRLTPPEGGSGPEYTKT